MLDNKLTKTINKKLATAFGVSSTYITETDPNSLGDPILDFESLLKGRANYYILENIAYAGINKSGVSHSVNTITPAFSMEKLLPYYPTSSTAIKGVCINTTSKDSIKHQFIITSGLFDSMSANSTGPTTHVLIPGYRYSSSSLDTPITEASSISYNDTIYYFIPRISTSKTCYLGIGVLDSCWSNCSEGPSSNPYYYPIQWVISNRIPLTSTYNYIVGVKNDGTSVVYRYSSTGVYNSQTTYGNLLTTNTYGRLGSNFYDILAALQGYTAKGTGLKPSYAMGTTYSYSSWGYTLCNPNTINSKYNIHVWQNSYTKTYTSSTQRGKFLGEYDGVAYIPLNNMGQYTSANTGSNLPNIYLYPGYLQSRKDGVNINYALTVNSTPVSITPTTGSKYLYILPKTSSVSEIVILIPFINSSGAWMPVYNATTAATNALAMPLEPTNYNYIIEVNYSGTGTLGVSAYVYSYDNNGIIDNRVAIGSKLVPLS